MTNSNLKRTTYLVIFFALCTLVLTGCGILGKNKSGQSSQKDGQNQEEKVPKQLEEMEATIERVFQSLGGPALKTADKEQEQSGQPQQQGDQSEQSQGQDEKQKQPDQKKEQDQEKDQNKEKEQDQEQGQEKQGQKSAEQETQQQPTDTWQTVSLEIKNLHVQWNDYMPQAAQKGAKKEILDDFSRSLNDLTKIADQKDKTKTMQAASSLYSNIPGIYSLYKTKISPEFKEITYYARDTIVYAMAEDWDRATSDMDKLKSSWDYLKNSMEQIKSEEKIKLDLSIAELEKVVKDKDPKLTDLKGRIVLTNLESLEKSLEGEEQEQGQGQGQGQS